MINRVKMENTKPKSEIEAQTPILLKLERLVSFNPPARAVLGVVQVATDLVMDTEGAQMIAKLSGVEIRFSKIEFKQEEICLETYMEAYESGAISAAIRALSLPAMDPRTGKAYMTQWGISCTSLSFLLGHEKLGECFPAGARWTDMWQGVLAALSAVTTDRPNKRLAVLTPYIQSVSQKNRELLQDSGFSVKAAISLDLTKVIEISAVDTTYITDCVMKMCATTEVDVVFIGCSSFRCCMPAFIDELEAQVGVPIVTSTQAFLWHMLREAGVNDTLDGYGKLFKL